MIQELTQRVGEPFVWAGEQAWEFLSPCTALTPPLAFPIVVAPGAAREVMEIFEIALRGSVPVVIAGISGRALPVDAFPNGPALVLNMGRLTRVLAIDEVSLTATAQAGISWELLESTLRERGFTVGFAPGDGDDTFSLGGLLATGLPPKASPRYGHVLEAVINTGYVLPDGTRVRTKLTPRSATGPDLDACVLGARGALGVITGATLRVHRLPPVCHTLVYRFGCKARVGGGAALESAIGGVDGLVRTGYRPGAVSMWTEKGEVLVGLRLEGSARTASIERDAAHHTMKEAGGHEKTRADLPRFSSRVEEIGFLARGSYAALAAAATALHEEAPCFPCFDTRGGYVQLDHPPREETSVPKTLTVVVHGGRQARLWAAAAALIARLKTRLDPQDQLNPGLLPADATRI